MTTKTKQTSAQRGRPKKDFSTIEIKVNKTGIRGRPKKENNLDKKTINQNKNINNMPIKDKNVDLETQNSTFINKKIDGKNRKKSDNFALGLLIFSMILFIFSLYKTFYTNKNIEKQDYNKSYQQTEVINSGITQEDTNKINEIPTLSKTMDEENMEIIKNFYDKINQKDFDELSNLVDVYLKSSNVFRTYYNKNRLSKFIENTINEKIYIGNIEKIENENLRNNVEKYGFIIKYKLNNNNELFKEKREADIVIRGEQKFIGSIRCVTTGCSKMPFFNPQKYGIK